MRIATFSVSLPTPDRKPGGVDVMQHRLACELAARGHHVRMHSYSTAPADANYEHVLLRSRLVGGGTVQRLIVPSLRLNQLDLRGFDVFHLHGDDWFYVRRSLPTVRTFYGSALFEARYGTRLRRQVSQSVYFPLEVLASRLATRSYSLVPGAADSRWYRTSGGLEFGQDPDPGVETLQREPQPAILFVGNWSGRKRGRLLAEVFRNEVRPRLPDAQLWMASDHAEPGDGITWLPHPSDAELADRYRRAWVFCLPSSYEGLGVPYLEAMAHGTAIVATPNIGARYILDHGRAGVLCPEGELGETLYRLLSQAALRDRFARAGLARVDHFRWNRIVELHEEAYGSAVSAWRRSRAV